MLIKGEKVTIREPCVSDEKAFIASVKRCGDKHHPWVSPPANKEDYLHYIKQCSNENQCSFLVIVQQTGELAGVYNLSNIVRGCFQSAYLGYYTLLPDSKKAYMSEALSLIINHAFFSLHLHRIEANIQPENSPSINLVKRLGFVEEGHAKNYLKINGFWRDHLHFSLTLERAQEFWIQQAHNKDKPWLPDFEFSATELEKFLTDNEPSLKAIETPKLLDNGWDNDVYLVDNYIFRCPRRQIAASLIERENSALDLLQGKLNLQIPNPQYKYLGPPQYNIPFHGYKMLIGVPLYKASLSRQDRADNIEAFALFLKQLHAVSIKNVVEAGLGPQVFDRTRKDNIFKHISSRVELAQLDSDLSDYKVAIKELCKLSQGVTLDKNPLVLVHGDLYSKHLIVENKTLRGVIDWGDVGLNHPVVDLAALYGIFPKDSHDLFYDLYGTLSNEVTLYAKLLAVHSALACLEFAQSHDDAQLETESLYSLSLIFE